VKIFLFGLLVLILQKIRGAQKVKIMDNDENYYDYHGRWDKLEEEGMFFCAECEKELPLEEQSEEKWVCKECYVLSRLIARNKKRLAGLK